MATRPTNAINRIAAANSNAYDPQANAGGLADGGHRQNFVPDLQAVVEVANYASALADEALASATNSATHADEAGDSAASAADSATAAAASAARLQGTSASSNSPTIGNKTFTTQTNKAFTAGTFLMIQSRGTPMRWMFGKVVSYASGTGALTVAVEAVGSASASGTDWDISVAGARGAIGADSWGNVTAWAATTAYSALAPRSVVVYDGETYVATVSHTSGSTFDAANWIKIAQKGSQLTKATGALVRAQNDDTAYLTAKTIQDANAPFARGTVNSNVAMDVVAEGINQSMTIAANIALSFANASNIRAGTNGFVLISQDGTGGRTLSFSASILWGDAGVPTLDTGANVTSVFFWTAVARNVPGQSGSAIFILMNYWGKF